MRTEKHRWTCTTVAMLGLIVTMAAGTADAACTVSEREVGGEPSIVLENEHVRLALQPGRGGRCTSLVHRASGQEWTGAAGALGLIIWNLQGGNEIDHSVFACEILEEGPERASVRLRGTGKTGFFRSVEFQKTVAIFAGQTRVRVDHEVKLDPNLMTPHDIGLQFHNLIGIPGQSCAYYFPTEEGVEKLDAQAELWRYNPARGWVAAVGPQGGGLVCEMEFKRLMCFYQWPVRAGVPTLEWMFRSASIPNGGSLKTTCWLMPFSSLTSVAAAENGTVISLETPGVPSPARPSEEVPVKLRLVSAEPRDLAVALTRRLLPAGQWVPIGETRLSAEADQAAEAEFSFTPDKRGTHVIKAAVRSSAALLAEAEKPVVVGQESAQYVLEPKEERLGDPGERFGKKPLYGEGPRDVVLTDDLVTPHVKWAKPYHKGRIKALVLVSYLVGREVIELAQRLDMDYATVSFENSASAMHYVPGFFHAWSGEQLFIAPRENLREKLKEDYDCLIVGGLKWDKFTDDAINATIAEKAARGMGIVWLQPNSLPEVLWELLPLRQTGERVWTSPELDARWERTQSHFLTEGVPFDVLPTTRYSAYEATAEPLASIVDSGGKVHPLLAAWEHPGGGRAVALSYNLSWQGAGSYMSGLTPWVVSTGLKFPYWEYYYSLLAKCALWAADREPEVQIESLASEKELYTEQDREAASVALRLHADRATSVELEVAVSDEFGQEEARFTQSVALPAESSTVELAIPADLTDGLHLADVIIRRAGEVINWGSAPVRVERQARITGLTVDQEMYHSGETVQARAELAGLDQEGAAFELDTQLLDGYARVVGSSRKALEPGTADVQVSFPVPAPLSTSGVVKCRLLRDGKAVAAAQQDFLLMPPEYESRQWDDYATMIWGGVTPYQREYLVPYLATQLKKAGIDTLSVSNSHWMDPFCMKVQHEPSFREGFRLVGIGMGNLPKELRALMGGSGDKFDEQAENYRKTKDKQYLERDPCMHDPAVRATVREKLRANVELLERYALFGYCFTDESVVGMRGEQGMDYDFSPHALRAFREWAQRRYESLDNLNQEWETTFGNWEDVLPMTTDEVKARDGHNYAPWADHREFMEYTFADFYGFLRDTVREIDPQARCGTSGTQHPGPHNGYDWWRLMNTLDYLHSYTHRNTYEFHRAFGGGKHRACWTGYAYTDQWEEHSLWHLLFNGETGTSIFVLNNILNPDWTLSPNTRAIERATRDMRAGVAKLLMNAERQNDVAIHYSQSSIRAAYITNQLSEFYANQDGWLKAVNDIGLQCLFVSYAQIESGALDPAQHPVLILPMSLAVSTREAEAIKSYARAGGVVIADAWPAVFDDHCRLRTASPLDDLFGVTRAEMKAAAPPVEGKLAVEQDFEACELKGLQETTYAIEADLTLAGGTALGQVGDVPALVVNRHGDGLAVLMNLSLRLYPRRRELEVEGKLQRVVEQLLRLGDVEAQVHVEGEASDLRQTYVVRYRCDGIEYVGVLRPFHGPANEPIWRQHEEEPPAAARIELPSRAYVYDVRAGKFLGETDQVTAAIKPAEAKLYALLPYRVVGLRLTVEPRHDQGETVSYQVAVESAAGRPGTHVIRVEAIGPDGSAREHYTRKLVAAHGRCKGTIPLALNDSAGQWTLRATDIATGVSQTAAFVVQVPRP